MKRSRIQRLAWCALACSLVFGTLTPVWADSSTEVSSSEGVSVETVIQSASIGRANIGNGSYMELKDVSVLPGDDGNTAAFTLTLYNGGTSDLEFIDYWVRLHSKTGSQFNVNLLAKDKDKNRIPSKTSQDFRFYAKLNATTGLHDLQFKLIEWDFSIPSFERVVGQLNIPEDYSDVTPSDAKRIVAMASVPVKTHIQRSAISQNDEYYMPAIYLEMENTGTSSVKLPDLQFYIYTKTGLIYPLQTAAFAKDTSIQPLVRKEGVLTGSIPREVDPEGWQLVITQGAAGTGSTGDLTLPLAFFELPDSAAEDVSIGNDYSFSNKSGTYTARLTSLQRLPWEDQDILTASVTISNKGSKTLPIPELKAYMMLDEAVKVEANAIRTDKVIGILPGREMTLQIAGKIPYTYEFQGIKLYLQEKDADKSVDLLTFHHNKELMNLAVIPVNGAREYKDIGMQSAYTVRNVYTFADANADLFAIQMDIENREKRFVDLRKQVAQFKTEDGAVFPAKVSEVKAKVTPGGKAMLFMSAVLPKGTKTEGIQLLLGDEVTIPATVQNESAKQDGYVNAAAFQLPAEQTEPKDSFKELDFYPYTISFSRFGTQADFGNNSVSLDFEYELIRNPLVEANMTDHKIVLEIKDELNDGKFITFSKAFDLDKVGDKEQLELGSHMLKISNFGSDPNIYSIREMKTYQMNIYYQYESGYKKLIASKEQDWFIYND
jgi:hypothetical protein